MSNQKLLTIFVLVLAVIIAGGYLLWSFSFNAMMNNMGGHMEVGSGQQHMDFSRMDMSEKRDSFLALRDSIMHNNMEKGDYACCLEKPCDSCIGLTPYHGEGTICNCLEDIMNGKHPCDECLGGILEGRGNKFLKDYFSIALSEGLGEEHLPTIEKIIEQKYPSEELDS